MRLNNQVLRKFTEIYGELLVRGGLLNKIVAPRLEAKGIPTTQDNLIDEVNFHDVMTFLKCSRSSAYDYVTALRELTMVGAWNDFKAIAASNLSEVDKARLSKLSA